MIPSDSERPGVTLCDSGTRCDSEWLADPIKSINSDKD